MALAPLRPGGVQAPVQVLSPAPGVQVLGGSPAPPAQLGRSPRARSGALAREAARAGPGLLAGPGFLALSAFSVKTEDASFPLLCVSLPQKAGCVLRPAFAQPPGGPGGACAKRARRARAGLQGRRPPTAPRVPPRLSLPERIQAASPPGCQGERRPGAGPARAGGGRQGSWHQKGKKRGRKKHFSHRSLSRNQKECGMAPFGAPIVSDMTLWKAEL